MSFVILRISFQGFKSLLLRRGDWLHYGFPVRNELLATCRAGAPDLWNWNRNQGATWGGDLPESGRELVMEGWVDEGATWEAEKVDLTGVLRQTHRGKWGSCLSHAEPDRPARQPDASIRSTARLTGLELEKKPEHTLSGWLGWRWQLKPRHRRRPRSGG